MAAFRTHVAAHGVAVTDPAWSESQAFLTRELLRELARRADGAAAAARVSLAGDPEWQRAVAVLRQARTAREVFALAGVTSGTFATPAATAASAKSATPGMPVTPAKVTPPAKPTAPGKAITPAKGPTRKAH